MSPCHDNVSEGLLSSARLPENGGFKLPGVINTLSTLSQLSALSTLSTLSKPSKLRTLSTLSTLSKLSTLRTPSTLSTLSRLSTLSTLGIGATVRTRQEIQCLPYAGFYNRISLGTDTSISIEHMIMVGACYHWTFVLLPVPEQSYLLW